MKNKSAKSSQVILAGTLAALSTATPLITQAQVMLEQQNSSVQFSNTKSKPAEVQRVNIANGSGIYAPALQITKPDGEIEFIRLGDRGLTRAIFYNDNLLKNYVSAELGFDDDTDVNIVTPPSDPSDEPASEPPTEPAPVSPPPPPPPLPEPEPEPCDGWIGCGAPPECT